MIVIIRTRLEMKYSMAVRIPPRRSHRMLPKIFMSF
jgi:hypothetical protein